MNFLIVIKVLGNLLILEALGLILPLITSIWYKQHDWISFLLTIIITGTIGLLMSWVSSAALKGKKDTAKNSAIKMKESLFIVTAGWILVSFFGTLPFIFSGSIPSFADAFFETVSGFTTTGATILKNVEAMPYGILFWRSFTHWIGGMGILVFTVAVLPALGVGSFQIFKAESPGPIAGRIVPRIKDTAKILYTTYLIMTALETFLLVLGGMSLYEALVHTFGTVGTGGFSSKNASVGAFNSSYINITIAIFMVFAASNFSLYYALYKGRWKEVIKDAELKFFLGVISISVILIAINITGKLSAFMDIGEKSSNNFFKSLEHAFFQVSSIISTSGYSTVDFDKWPTFSKGILLILMFIGGCAGSTGGGITSIRILVILKLIRREIRRILHPRAIIPVKLGGEPLSMDIVNSISGFFALYIIIFVLGTLALTLEGISLVSASSAVAATLGNIGPGFEMVGPSRNYSQLSAASKYLMSGLMLMGRLELFTVIALFSKRLWKDD